MITATRKVRICAGHRVCGHESKCANLHGHDYAFEVTAVVASGTYGGRKLDELGRVVDFSVLKDRVGGWLDREWDHRFLLWEDDQQVDLGDEEAAFGVVRVPFNPTAENIATHVGEVICPDVLAGTGVDVVRVVVHETPNCFATWEHR